MVCHEACWDILGTFPGGRDLHVHVGIEKGKGISIKKENAERERGRERVGEAALLMNVI